MSDTDKAAITRALISVSDKTNLLTLGRFLAERGVEILSTGGSAKTLREGGVSVKDVAEHTGFPEIMDGRVKTLHPLIHGGLLARRDDSDHLKAMADHDIAPIDLVVINLYPFEETVASGAGAAEVIENIDIGGPSMVRSAAKNHAFVTVVTDPDDYDCVMAEIKENNGATSFELRRRLARATGGTRNDRDALGINRHGTTDRKVFVGLGHVAARHDEEFVDIGRRGDDGLGAANDDAVFPFFDDPCIAVWRVLLMCGF